MNYLIPKPFKITQLEGILNLNGKFNIKIQHSCLEKERIYLKNMLKTIKQNNLSSKPNIINLSLSNEYSEEGYRLYTKNNNIFIIGGSTKGVFYGIQTFLGLIQQSKEIYNIDILDYPRFFWRGFMLDSVRHFFNVEEIKKILDIMAFMKMNIFHWHLTDDQGWRLEIKAFPKLTEIGSKRKGTKIGRKYDNTPVKGFYTQEDVTKIINYAKDRHITVIPEIDMPGHSSAAISAYSQLSCENLDIDVPESFGIKDTILCVGSDFSNKFLHTVLDEVSNLFPAKYIHIGGDEVPKKRWKKCKLCTKKLKENNLNDYQNLQGLFTNEIIKYLKSKNKIAISWNDVWKNNNIDKESICQFWIDGLNAKNIKTGIKEGRKIIVSDYQHYYLDYPYYVTSLRKTYTFNPNILKTDKDPENIIGIEAPLWTEYVEDNKQLEIQMLPRLLAVAERGWSHGIYDYEDFKMRMKPFILMLKKRGFCVTKKYDEENYGTNRYYLRVKYLSKIIYNELYQRLKK